MIEGAILNFLYQSFTHKNIVNIGPRFNTVPAKQGRFLFTVSIIIKKKQHVYTLSIPLAASVA